MWLRSLHHGRRHTALAAMSTYYVVGGLWPIVWYRSFTWVTGDKRDDWLVKTFGLLLAAYGGAVAVGLRRGEHPVRPSVAVAGSIAAADVWYVLRGRIRPVYLLDAAVEVALAAVLARTLNR